MHIGRAFCVEAERVVDIYQARALFFAQEIPRRRFQFLCSDDTCREANATRVTGVNYDKLVEDGRDRIVVKPHFRMNQETPHNPECEWVARERLLNVRASWDLEQTRGSGANGFRRLKINDLIDVFAPSFSTTAVTADGTAESTGATSSGQKAFAPERDPNPHRPQSTPTSVNFLDAVVTVYELLGTDERREAVLRIGQGPKLPYSRAFCRVENYFAAKGERIFHGGVKVQLHGPNFAVRFFDRVPMPKEARVGNAIDLSLYLKRAVLLNHWNGKFLISQLVEAATLGNYAHCYFYGTIQPHATAIGRLVVVIESLEYLAFTVRRKRAGATRCNREAVIRQARSGEDSD